jgi:flavin reductase (DIM6/NTAB) family NADH-FMN oxidoreductase RutF
VDITADLNDEDHTGYVWTFLDEARDPGQIRLGAIVVAGDADTAVVCRVIDLVPAGDGTIVHLKVLSGLAENYQAAEKSIAS